MKQVFTEAQADIVLDWRLAKLRSQKARERMKSWPHGSAWDDLDHVYGTPLKNPPMEFSYSKEFLERFGEGLTFYRAP